MPETLRDFIERRAEELDKLREPILAQMRVLRDSLKEIDRERDELDAALNAIAARERQPQMLLDVVNDAVKIIARTSDKTIKDAVLSTLSKYHKGLVAHDILSEVNLLLGTSYLRTSLSPQLSRLKSEGLIILDGNVWKLAPQKDKAADETLMEETPAAFSRDPAQGREAGPGGGT